MQETRQWALAGYVAGDSGKFILADPGNLPAAVLTAAKEIPEDGFDVHGMFVLQGNGLVIQAPYARGQRYPVEICHNAEGQIAELRVRFDRTWDGTPTIDMEEGAEAGHRR